MAAHILEKVLRVMRFFVTSVRAPLGPLAKRQPEEREHHHRRVVQRQGMALQHTLPINSGGGAGGRVGIAPLTIT